MSSERKGQMIARGRPSRRSVRGNGAYAASSRFASVELRHVAFRREIGARGAQRRQPFRGPTARDRGFGAWLSADRNCSRGAPCCFAMSRAVCNDRSRLGLVAQDRDEAGRRRAADGAPARTCPTPGSVTVSSAHRHEVERLGSAARRLRACPPESRRSSGTSRPDRRCSRVCRPPSSRGRRRCRDRRRAPSPKRASRARHRRKIVLFRDLDQALREAIDRFAIAEHLIQHAAHSSARIRGCARGRGVRRARRPRSSRRRACTDVARKA